LPTANDVPNETHDAQQQVASFSENILAREMLLGKCLVGD